MAGEKKRAGKPAEADVQLKQLYKEALDELSSLKEEFKRSREKIREVEGHIMKLSELAYANRKDMTKAGELLCAYLIDPEYAMELDQEDESAVEVVPTKVEAVNVETKVEPPKQKEKKRKAAKENAPTPSSIGETTTAKKPKKAKSPKKGETSQNDIPESSDMEVTEVTSVEKRPPPLVVDKSAWDKVSEGMKEKQIEPHKAFMTADGIKILLNKATDYVEVRKLLDKGKVNYFTYSLPEDRLLHVVIRGLPSDIAPQRIERQLKGQGFTPKSVSLMRKRNEGREPMPLFAVAVPRGETKILNVQKIVGLTVKVVPRYADKRVKQCHKCQGFNHVQKFCTWPPKCVKCGKGHLSTQCGEKKGEMEPRCANCQGRHPAFKKSCPRFPKASVGKRNETRPITRPAFRKEGVSFAKAAGGNRPGKGEKDNEKKVIGMETDEPDSQNSALLHELLELLKKHLGQRS